jgi:hypothetical protein
MTVALIDDQLLGQVLRGRTPKALLGSDLYTTGYWYVRLCQAVLSAHERTGVLSQPLAGLTPALRAKALRAVLELPVDIGLVSLRDLAPVIGQLRAHHQLNILSIEALSAATHLRATVYLSAPSPLLEGALASEKIAVKVTVAKRDRSRR